MPQQDVLEKLLFAPVIAQIPLLQSGTSQRQARRQKTNYSDQQEPIIKPGLSSQQYIHTK